MSEVRRYRVADLISSGILAVGDGYRAKNDELGPTGLPFCRAGNVQQGFDFAGADRFPEAHLSRVGEKLSQPGDVVFTSKGTVGRFARVRRDTERFVYSPQLCYWRSLDLGIIEPDYLFYWMSGTGFREQFRAVAGQTDMAEYVSLGDQRRMWLDLPSLQAQGRVARILGALDDKIELNRAVADRMHELARLVFEAQIGAAAMRSLTLGDILETVETGGRPPGGVSGYREGVPSIGAESITRLGEFDFSKTKYVPVEYFMSMRRGRLENRDVLLYKDGGRPGLFEPHLSMVGDGFPFEVAAINEHVYRLRASAPYTQSLLYFWLSGTEAMDEMRVKGTGVAIPGLNSTALRSIRVPDVASDVARELDSALEPLVARVLLAANQSRTLAQIRDLLLPRLLDGEREVAA